MAAALESISAAMRSRGQGKDYKPVANKELGVDMELASNGGSAPSASVATPGVPYDPFGDPIELITAYVMAKKALLGMCLGMFIVMLILTAGWGVLLRSTAYWLTGLVIIVLLTSRSPAFRALIPGVYIFIGLLLLKANQEEAAELAVEFWNAHAWCEENLPRWLIRTFNPIAHESHTRALAYYNAQRPLFEVAAREYQLHWVFAATASKLTASWTPTWYELIQARLEMLGVMLTEHNRDDFRIEKDKCRLVQFFQTNRLPTAPTFGPWFSQESFLASIKSADALSVVDGAPMTNAKFWPSFLKCCHLTIGGGRSSVWRLKSLKYAQDHATISDPDGESGYKDSLKNFMDYFWTLRPNDAARSWRLANNYLTDNANLVPGVMLQSSVGEMVELKIEVLWGKAYVGAICQPDEGSLLTRWPNGTFEVEVFPEEGQPVNLLKHAGIPLGAPGSEGFKSKWMLEDPAYLQCAWDMAEYAATAMAIDEVRMDIFVVKGQPRGCRANENSISSGVPYGAHFAFMSEIWKDAHVNKWYTSYKTDLHVYEQTADDVPGMKEKYFYDKKPGLGFDFAKERAWHRDDPDGKGDAGRADKGHAGKPGRKKLKGPGGGPRGGGPAAKRPGQPRRI